MEKKVSPENYESLCCSTIGSIILLNRRRPGEVVNAELFQYLNRPPVQKLGDDVLKVLSAEEIQTLPLLSVFMVPGKLVRTVPILITKSMEDAIEAIISARTTLKIPDKNKLLFPRVYTEKPFDGSKILRQLKNKCHLNNPEGMTATALRHHLATKTTLVGKENFTENICEHMGHTKDIHKQNYRQPLQAIQRGKVGSHLLNLVGKSYEHASKSYGELPINKEPHFEAEVVQNCGKNPDDDDPSYDMTQHYMSSLSDEEDLSSDEDQYVIKKPRKHTKWTDEEKIIVINNFKSFIQRKKTPGRVNCENLKKTYPILNQRTWQQINVVVANVVSGKLKPPSGVDLN